MPEHISAIPYIETEQRARHRTRIAEKLNARRMFREKLANAQFLETENGVIKYVELRPDAPESEIPIILLGGFGTDINSTKRAAKSLYNQNRTVILMEHPRVIERDNQPLAGIDGLQLQQADNLNRVAEATGHEKMDLVVQSGAALYATAAVLREPDHFRSLVIESGAGLIGQDATKELMKRFTKDAIGPRYLKNPGQATRYMGGLARHIKRQGIKNSLNEVSSIASSQIDEALIAVRQSGVKVAVITTNADSVFGPERVNDRVMNMETGYTRDNVDAYSVVADKRARHGAILFDEVGVRVALNHIRQFEIEALSKNAQNANEVVLV